MTTFIYGLKDPETGEIKYIGKANNPERRLKDHMTEHRGEWTKVDWIRRLKARNLKPSMEILEEVDMSEWQEREIKYIELYGETILNEHSGGNGLSIANKTSFKRK